MNIKLTNYDCKVERMSEAEELTYFDYIKKEMNVIKRSVAINKIIMNHLPFIIGVAIRCPNRDVPLEDRVNTGVIGMHRAILSYEPSKGIKFLCYAVWWIIKEIREFNSAKGDLIHIPKNIQTALTKKINEATKNGEDPEFENTQDPLFYAYCAKKLISLETPVQVDGEFREGFTIEDIIPGEDLDKLTEVCSNKESIYSVLKTELGKEEYGLLCNWFGLNDYAETQKEVDIARSIGMEPGKFKTIKNRIFRKLRNPMKRYQFNY